MQINFSVITMHLQGCSSQGYLHMKLKFCQSKYTRYVDYKCWVIRNSKNAIMSLFLQIRSNILSRWWHSSFCCWTFSWPRSAFKHIRALKCSKIDAKIIENTKINHAIYAVQVHKVLQNTVISSRVAMVSISEPCVDCLCLENWG